MLYSAEEHACPTVELPSGEKEIYVVGGWGSGSRVSIFNVASEQWRNGEYGTGILFLDLVCYHFSFPSAPDFPVKGGIRATATVPYKDTFIMAGGHIEHASGKRESIWK